MPSNQPLLTLALPTYNRSRQLSLLLDTLAPQLAHEDRVELLISDNASPDDTPQVIQRFLDAGLRCRYMRNQTNIGPDLNFLQCFEQAAGQYFWLFGDDDFLFPGSLAKLLDRIQHTAFDLIYMAPFGFLHQPNERRLANPAAPSRTFHEASQFIHAVGFHGDLALITAVVVNKERIARWPHPPFTDALGTMLPQLSWVFSALNHFESGLIFERGLYAVCEDNPSRPFDIAQVFGVNWFRMAQRFLDSGSKVQDAILDGQLYSWFPTNWFGQRKSRRLTQHGSPSVLLRPLYGDRLLYWVFVHPLLILPDVLAGMWLAVLRTIRLVDRAYYRLRV